MLLFIYIKTVLTAVYEFLLTSTALGRCCERRKTVLLITYFAKKCKWRLYGVQK